MTNTIRIYSSFVALAAASLVGLMFYLEPKMIIPSLIGVVIFTFIIYRFYKATSHKSAEEQRRIAKRNGVIGYIGVIVLLAIFFIAGAKNFNMQTWDFIRLWFGF